MISNERKIQLIKELLKDHYEQKLSSFAAMIALRLIVDPKTPSKECMEFMKTSIELNKGGIKNENI